MLTLTFQTVAALLKLVFVATAFALLRHLKNDGDLAASSWRWAAAAFLVSGVSGAVQAVWAVVAFFAGAGTTVYEVYLWWAPPLNYSRFGVMIVMGAGLAVLPVVARRHHAIDLRRLLFIFVATLVISAVPGLAEGVLIPALHQTRIAALQAAQTAALLAALFASVLWRGMDSWLWLALFVYAVRQAINALIWAATATGAAAGAWQLPFWVGGAVGVVMWCVMIAIVRHRLSLARTGRPVADFFDRDPRLLLGGDR